MFCFLLIQGDANRMIAQKFSWWDALWYEALYKSCLPTSRAVWAATCSLDMPRGKSEETWVISAVRVLSENWGKYRESAWGKDCLEDEAEADTEQAQADRMKKERNMEVSTCLVRDGLVSPPPLGSSQRWFPLCLFSDSGMTGEDNNNATFSCIYRNCQCATVLKSAHWSIQLSRLPERLAVFLVTFNLLQKPDVISHTQNNKWNWRNKWRH